MATAGSKSPEHNEMSRVSQAVEDITQVLPRSVTALRHAGGWPALSVRGARQLAEVALDEAVLCGMTLLGPMGELTRPADDYRRVADEMTSLGLAKAHAEPNPMHLSTIRRRRIGSLTYERMEYAHDPQLPGSLDAEGLGGPAIAVTHMCRHVGGPRPWLVWVHGTGQGGPTDLYTSRAHRYFRGLGFNVAAPIQPGQGVRRHTWPPYPDVDPIVNLAGTVRAISEVRAVIRWLAPQATSITVAGLSLGSAVAALVSHLEHEVAAVALYTPILGLNQMIAQHQGRWGESGAEVGRVMRSEAVVALTSVVDPLGAEPAPPPERRLIVGAWHDRMALRAPAEALNRKWGGEMYWHDGSHCGHLFSRQVQRVTEDFLGAVEAV